MLNRQLCEPWKDILDVWEFCMFHLNLLFTFMSCVSKECALFQKHSHLTNSKARVYLVLDTETLHTSSHSVVTPHHKFLCCTCSSHVLPLIFLLSPFDAESSFIGTPGPALSPIPLLSVTLLLLTAEGGLIKMNIFWARIVKRESICRLYIQSSWDKITARVRVHGERSDTSECSGVWV